MADNLIFPIKFDLEAAVREAQGDADRLLRRLQTTINAKPLAVNLKIPGAGSGSINEINSRLKELIRQWNNLTEAQRITNKTTGEYTAEAKKILAEYTRLRGASESYAQSLKQIDSAAKKAAKQQEKLAEAAYRGSNAFKNQEGYVSRLVKRLAVYASFQYTSQFLTNIREVTAQFELQRISLGAIIQDQQKANQIFAEIKSFALTSPLKILDLTKYTKQVAAYGFETEKLFDTTKMLADISVGLGSDMSRATLFLGQVFATGHLRAAELRQATELGIPLVDKLAKKLEELNGRFYSAADVMDLISKRAISFEMVESVFKDMTSAGGEFYNMQVKQSQTLFGMWSKLGDAAAIMYDQIGNTSSINAGMKLAIRSIESMMRNWKTTARVLDSVAVAMTVYIVGLKNAAVASKALTSAVALENLAHQQQIIRTPKVVAGIIGINNAKKISTLLTNLHTKAVLSEAAATNVLTKGFWKLTAAMLANPWVAAASAIALIGVALFHFIGNAETAAERAEKLNNSVASLKNLDDTTKPLIDTYNELINKTERTAEEQKKLSEVTHELAKQYPGAITAIGNFGAEVELAADKLNQLYQVEKQARMDNTRHELQETEKQIASTEAKIAQLQKYLSEGKMWVGGGGTGGGGGGFVAMSDEEKGRVLAQIDELRFGADGQSGLFGLQQSAEAARRALGLIPSEAAQAVEKFGAWKKTFTTFRKQVGDVRVQLFDDSTIAQFGSLEEALKKTAEEYKKNIALVATYDETLKSATLTSEERAKIETERAEADAMANLAEKALKYYNAMSLLNTSTSGRSRSGTKSDNRLQNLQEIEQTLTKINQKYDELAKKEGQTKALEDINKLYANTLKYVNKLGKQFKLSFKMPTEFKDLQDYRKAILDVINTLKMKGYQKAALDLEEKIGTGNLDALQKQIEKQLKELSDRISRTKTAKEFYEKILGQTGDIELATRVSLSIYGSTGEELFEDTVKQIREVFKSGNKDVEIDLSPVFDMTNQRINYKTLADIYDKYQDQIIEKNRSTAENIVKEGQKTAASNIATWEKELAKAKDYEKQRTDIINRETQRRAEIYKSNLPQEEKDRLAAQSQRKQDEDLAKVNFEEFTKSEDYIKIFENLDNVATSSLKRLRAEMQALIDTNQNLSPENMKTLVKAMEDIDEQISGRGFGNDMIQSVNDYIASIKNLKTAKQELAEAEAEYQAQLPQLDEDIATAEDEKVEAQRALSDLKNNELATENQIVAAELRLNTATANVAKAEQAKAKAANKVKKAEQKVTGEQDKQKKATTKFFKDIEQAGAAASNLASILGDVKDLLGVSEDSAEGLVFDSAIQGLQEFSKIMNVIIGLQTLYNIVTSSNPWIAIAAAVLAVTAALASYISNSKVRKANKEIERQQNLLDQLEYTYGRLEKAADKLFGADYISNYNQRMKNLQAQAAAYQKQYEAEKSKGKKADEEKLKEFQEQYRDTMDEIADMQEDLIEHFTGSSRTDVARQMAKSWIDARASMSDTFAAIKGDYQDLIKNMIVEGAAARVIENALSPLWKQIEDAYKSNNPEEALDKALQGMNVFLNNANNGMEVLWKALEARGYDMKKLISGTDSEYTGIAKNIAGATSEEINTAAAIGNTLMYYVSPIPRMDENLARVVAIMEGRGASLPTASGATTGAIDYTEMFTTANQHLSSLPRMEQHLAEIHTMLGRALRTKGATTGFNTFLN